MRTLSIAGRVLKEMIRDKRTLALMFVAPIVIILLLGMIFSVNSTVNVKVGTVAVSKSVNTNLKDTKHVTVTKYDTKADAKKALDDHKIDSIIQKKNSNYDLTYANTDSSKTTAVKMALRMRSRIPVFPL